MATRMVLVPEDQKALAYRQKINISPQVRSLSNLDALVRHVLYKSKLSTRKIKRKRPYNQLNIQKQNILRQYGDTGLRPAVELAQPRVPPRRQSLNKQDLVTEAPSADEPTPPRRRAVPRPQPPHSPRPVPAPRLRAPAPTPPP